VLLGFYYYLIIGPSPTSFGVLIHHHQAGTQTIVILIYTLLLRYFYYLITGPLTIFFDILIQYQQEVSHRFVLLSYTLLLITCPSATAFVVRIHHHRTVTQTILLLMFTVLLGSFIILFLVYRQNISAF
jgi:hypothetical protein